MVYESDVFFLLIISVFIAAFDCLQNLYLDKLQGDDLTCQTNCGNIITDSCYVEKSKFETSTGKLELKNVHKTSEVHIHEAGELKMSEHL